MTEPFRIAYKFTSFDGISFSYTFPTALFEYEPSNQPLDVPVATLTGANYGHDQLGDLLARKELRQETVRFLLYGDPVVVSGQIDDMKEALYGAGRGKLWTRTSDGDERWCVARLMDVPGWRSQSVSVTIPVSLRFQCFSDFHPDDEYDFDFAIGSSPETIIVDNIGNAPVYDAEFELSGTYTNPVILNTTTGYRMESARDGGGASDILRFISPRYVDFSSDTGATWAGDYANYVRTRGQIQLMKLLPGYNVFTVTGVTSGTLTVRFWPAFH